MKKTFLIIFMLFLTLGIYSQNTSVPHLTFNGIEISGNSSSFIQKMKNKGYTLDKTDDDLLFFSGNFIGKSTDGIVVLLTPKTRQVWKVVVYFSECTFWYTLKNEYNELKSQLIQKYGSPKNDFNFFSSPYEEGDGYELTGVKIEKCNYSCFWDNGIYIEISKYCEVKLTYEDPVQGDIFTKEDNEITQDGL